MLGMEEKGRKGKKGRGRRKSNTEETVEERKRRLEGPKEGSTGRKEM